MLLAGNLRSADRLVSKLLMLAIAGAAGLGPFPARSEPAYTPIQEPKDCIVEAAAYHQVHSLTLRAIGWFESKLKPGAVGKNTNGSVDVGAFQTNSIHFDRLARAGVNPEALKDGCVSAYVAASMLKEQIAAYGNNWTAVGNYHSKTPARSRWYANQIFLVMRNWGAFPKETAAPFPDNMSRPPIAGQDTGGSKSDRQGNSATVVFDDSNP